MNVLNKIILLFNPGFIESVIVLLVLRTVLRSRRLLWDDLFVLSNSILLVASALYGIICLTELFDAWYGQIPGDQIAFKWPIMGPYWYIYWGIITVQTLTPQMFWFRTLRKSAVASVAILPFLSIGAIVKMLIIWFAPFRDARPSAWTYYSQNTTEYLIPFLLFCSVLAAVYFMSGKWQAGRVVR